METHLTIKHLAGYLPYGLKVMDSENRIYEMSPFNGTIYSEDKITYRDVSLCLEFSKPILHPLSDLTKEIEVNGEKFVPLIELLRLSNFDVSRMKTKEQLEFEQVFCNMDFISHKDAQKLYEWHFDIHNLIEQNLAIDKNTIK